MRTTAVDVSHLDACVGFDVHVVARRANVLYDASPARVFPTGVTQGDFIRVLCCDPGPVSYVTKVCLYVP